MRVLTRRARHLVNLSIIIAGLMALLVLPLRPGSATGPAYAVGPNRSASDLDRARTAALHKLSSQLEAGFPFAEEETLILRRFNAGGPISELEADTVICRALYDFYIAGTELNRVQQELLSRYMGMVARRDKDVADLKTQLLDQRKAAAAAAWKLFSPLAVPANDLCSGAEVIPAAGPFPYLTAVTADITDATTAGDPPLPSCQTNVSRSIWYRFTPSATATYTISTCSLDGTATTVDDTVMAIYTGACGGLTEIPTTDVSDGCDDDACADEGLQSVIRTQLNGGVTYFIVVWEFDPTPPTAGNTAVQLKVRRDLAPANDNCGGATALTLNTPLNGTIEFATDDYVLSGSACFTGVGSVPSASIGRDVVYSFTAPFADTYSIRVKNYIESSLSNLVVYSASSCPAAGGSHVTVATCLNASNRDVDSTAEEILCQSLVSNQQIFIFIDEDDFTDGSPFTIEVTRCASESEPNDTPATASALRFGIEGSINPGANVDFFSLGASAPGSRVFALVDGVAGNSTDFDMRMTTSTDTLEYDDSNADTPFGFASPSIAGTMLTAAPAFIRINQFAAAAAEPYRLYAIVQPPSGSATPESEPNDTIGAADSALNNYFSGSLSGPAPSTDTDLFSFTASAGELIFLSLDSDPLRDNTPINAALALLGPVGVQLVAVNDGGAASSTSSGAGSLISTTPSSPSEAIVFRATTAGTYYARVTIGTSATTAVGAGDYLLSITRNGLIGSCTYFVNPSSQPFIAGGGSGMVSVTADIGCAWTAVSDNPSFITVSSGASGSGNGSVMYSVATNSSGSARTGSITIGGQVFIVSQAGSTCTFSLGGTSQSFGAASGSGGIGVTAQTGCGWTATSNASWLTVTAGGSGTGNGMINYSVGSNLSVNSRTGAITVVDQTFTVNQSGIPAFGLNSYKTDLDGDGKSDLGFYRSGLWGWLKSSQSYSFGSAQFFSWGGAGLQPIVADFDGDGKVDMAYMVPAAGAQSAAYAILKSTTNYNFTQAQFVAAGWPSLGDIPVVGDFDGDGKADPGVWRASQGVWIIPKSSSSYTSFIFSQWGQLGDVPVIADVDGDGKADIGFYRDGLWGFLKSTQNYSYCCGQFFSWGGAGLQPVIGDFDGDGKPDLAYMVPPAGGQSGAYAILKSSTNYDLGQAQFLSAGFPSLGDTPAVGEYDGDGKADPGIWRESQGVWIIPKSSSSYTSHIFTQWGQAGDIPFPDTANQN